MIKNDTPRTLTVYAPVKSSFYDEKYIVAAHNQDVHASRKLRVLNRSSYLSFALFSHLYRTHLLQ
jgi:hypothetical protein